MLNGTGSDDTSIGLAGFDLILSHGISRRTMPLQRLVTLVYDMRPMGKWGTDMRYYLTPPGSPIAICVFVCISPSHKL